MRKPYSYAPLDHDDSTRLIQLKPAPEKAFPLAASITELRLDNSPPFDAISYAWGDASTPECLWTSVGLLKITTSLATALRHFRLQDRPRWLWADAVCINQTDNDEKGHQVAQMSRIYRAASKVLAWLGEGSDEVREAMGNCERLYPHAERFLVQDKDIDYEVFSGPKLRMLNSESEEVSLSTWSFVGTHDETGSVAHILKDIRSSGLDALVSLPWFGRLWIIQEAASSANCVLYAGKVSLEWRYFASVMRLLMAIVQLNGPWTLLHANEDHRKLTPALERAWNLVDLRTEHRATGIGRLFCISTYRQFGGSLVKAALHECFDDRDRIYGLLGLCSELAINRGVTMKPDYNKAAPEIYRDFALQYLVNPGVEYPPDARILADAGLWQRTPESWEVSRLVGQSSVDYLPSWVPEYRPRNLSRDELPWKDTGFDTRWHTCPPSIHELKKDSFDLPPGFVDNRNMIGIFGTLVDRVETIAVMLPNTPGETATTRLEKHSWTATLHESIDWKTACGCIESLWQVCQMFLRDGKYHTGEDGRAAFMRTLLAERTHPEISRIAWTRHDPKDEAGMIALWSVFEKCLLEPQGEVRAWFESGETLADSPPKLEEWKTKVKEPSADGRSKFSDEAKDALELMLTVIWVLSRCKFIFSTRGMFALVPRAAKQYDHIVQLEGTKMPFVVRPMEGGLTALVGPCYVHGLMHCPSPEADFEISRRGGVICFA
jgi:hypothetical protein